MNKFLNQSNNINYLATSTLRDLRNRKITTVDEYVQWVREWKQEHRELVAAIKFLRALKNIAKSEKDYRQCDAHWLDKRVLGGIAHKMYEARTDNKAALKAGKFLETAEA